MSRAPLVPCPSCHRHARASAPCPFCGTALALPEEVDTDGPVHAATRARIVFGVTVGTIAVTTALFGTACPAYGCPSGGCFDSRDSGTDASTSAIDGGGADTGDGADTGSM